MSVKLPAHIRPGDHVVPPSAPVDIVGVQMGYLLVTSDGPALWYAVNAPVVIDDGYGKWQYGGGSYVGSNPFGLAGYGTSTY